MKLTKKIITLLLIFYINFLYARANLDSTDNQVYSNQSDSCILYLSGKPKNATITIEHQKNKNPTLSFKLDRDSVYLDSLYLGYYNLEIFKYGYEAKSVLLLLLPGKLKTYNFNLSPTKKSKAILFSTILAGTGQLYSQQKIKGNIYLYSESLALTSLLFTHYKFINLAHEFRIKQRNYRLNKDLNRMDELYYQMEKKHNEAKNYKKVRNAIFIFYTILHLSNIIDIIWNWPFTKSFNQTLDINDTLLKNNLINFTLTF
jgi:hypothetical protein